MASTRRRFIGAVTASLAIAGCLGDPGGDVARDTETDSPADPAMDDTPTATGTDGDADSTSTASPSGDGTETDGETGTDGGPGTASDDGTATTVRVASHEEHGDVLVDDDGMTLYMFDSDAQGSGASTCTDGCASAWPPLTVDGEPTAGPDVTADLSTFDRDDASRQVAANGWPLYYYANDGSPGDATGQGVSDAWWVLGPDGTPKRDGATATETETESGRDY